MRVKCHRCGKSLRPGFLNELGILRNGTEPPAKSICRVWICPTCIRPYTIKKSEIEQSLGLRWGTYMTNETRKVRLREDSR